MNFSTGPIVGVAAATDAFQPSLMPTPTVDQGISAGASLFTAGVTAHIIDRSIAHIAKRVGGNEYATRAVVAGIGIGVSSAFKRRDGESLGRAAVRTGATVAAATAITGAALQVANETGRKISNHIPGGRVIVPVIGIAKVALGAGLLLRSRLRRFEDDGRPMPEPETVAKSATVAIALGGGVAALVTGERAAVRGASNRAPGPTFVWRSGGHGAALALVGAGAAFGLRKMLGKIEAANNKVEPGYAEPPATPTVTAAPGSSVPYKTLGHQGRRFVSEVATPERIRTVMGEDPHAEPVRIYVGYLSADDVQGRIDLAVEEMRRTGALERSVVIVSSPAGTGYVNYIPIEAAEYMGRGDVASIAVQYGRRPSLMSADRITPGAHHFRSLIDAIQAECERTGLNPRVVVYGESLGAHTSQDAFLHQGTDGLRLAGVDRALWVGTPYRSEWKEEVFRDDRPDVDRAAFGVFNSIDEVNALRQADREELRIFFLNHWNDPVTRFGIDLSVQQPSWLGPPDQRPPTISSTQRWTPIVTFWQTAIDTKNAATVIPGEFFATGHDYRADLAEFVRAAYGFDDVAPQQMERIEAQLRRSEMDRADRIAH